MLSALLCARYKFSYYYYYYIDCKRLCVASSRTCLICADQVEHRGDAGRSLSSTAASPAGAAAPTATTAAAAVGCTPAGDGAPSSDTQ